MKTFLRNGLSIDETKISVLIIAFSICFVFSLIMYFFRGDINNNLLELCQWLIAGVAGVNVVDKFNKFSNKIKNNNDDSNDRFDDFSG